MKLKPCPFCGSNETELVKGDEWYVACLTCWADGPTGGSNEKAEEQWNYRHRPSVAEQCAELGIDLPDPTKQSHLIDCLTGKRTVNE